MISNYIDKYITNEINFTNETNFCVPLAAKTVTKIPNIKQIIINPPATITIWIDGTKTVCKTNEEYDPEVGVAMCIAKKYFGSRNQFIKAVKAAMKDFEWRTQRR